MRTPRSATDNQSGTDGTDKDRTDTELALDTAAELNPAHLTLISGGGDRLDHTLAAIGALGMPSLTSIPTIDGWWGDQRMVVVHGPGKAHIEAVTGTTLSLLSLHGTCGGVTVTGVAWPLDDAELRPMAGLGLSNVSTAEAVDVSLTSGVLTIFVNVHLDANSSEQT